MKIDFRTLANSSVRNLIPYKPGKPIEELERELGITESIKLASNENPLGSSPTIFAAIQKVVQKAHIYPDAECFELKQELAKFLLVQSEQLTIGNGSENILELIVKAYLNKGDTAVISQYAFLTIPILLQSYGVQAHVVPAQNYGHDIANMLKAIDEKTRVLFLVNPNNPTGTYINETDFHTFMESVPSHVLVVVDEAYFEYISLSDYPRTLNYLPKYPNLIITRTFSKVYGLAGLRLGYGISSVEIADILNRTRLPFSVNAIAAKAACIALNDQAHVKKSVLLNQEGLQQFAEELKKLRLGFIPSIGNFTTIDVGNGVDIFQKLLPKGIIVRPLKPYGLHQHIRVTVGTYEQNERFLSALKQVQNE